MNLNQPHRILNEADVVKMRILVKLPSRERPQKLLQRIEEYQSLASSKSIKYLVSLDTNDGTCNNDYIIGRLKELNCIVYVGDSVNKVDACNRDIEKVNGWDILILASDDMVCQVNNWDLILSNEMESFYPDTDGVLWHWDGDNNTRVKLNTMCILGYDYYKRFNYIYHQDYRSLFCDNEFTEVANRLGKQSYFEQVLFKHIHFSNTHGIQRDALMNRTQSFYQLDKLIYEQRKSINFNLK